MSKKSKRKRKQDGNGLAFEPQTKHTDAEIMEAFDATCEIFDDKSTEFCMAMTADDLGITIEDVCMALSADWARKPVLVHSDTWGDEEPK